MREILFRGIPKEKSDGYTFSKIWSDNCDGSFVYGSLLISKGKYYICASSIFKINCCINNAIMSVIEVIPESVGQYTGLTDKNGKKIFEGDLLESRFSENKEDWKIWQVSFEDGSFVFDSVRKSIKSRRKFKHEQNLLCIDEIKFYGLVKIGNIHDNKLEDF